MSILHVTHLTRPDWLERNDWVSWDPLWDGRGFSGADLQHTNYSQLKHTMTNKWEETQMRTFCTTHTNTRKHTTELRPSMRWKGFLRWNSWRKVTKYLCTTETQEGKQQSCKCNLNSTDTYSSFSILFLLLERE